MVCKFTKNRRGLPLGNMAGTNSNMNANGAADGLDTGSKNNSPSSSQSSATHSMEINIHKGKDSDEEQGVSSTGEYIVDRNRPETFLNSEDLERVTESDIFPQKRLFSFLHSRKMPEIPTEEERKRFPIFSANYLSRLFIFWVYPAVRTGYKRTIQPNDLFKIEKRYSIEVLFADFDKNMNFYFEKAKTKYLAEHPDASEDEIFENVKLPKNTVLKAVFFTFKKQYIWAIICANLANCASALNPMITKRLINFVEQKSLDPSMHVNKGIGYAIGACLMMVVNGLAFNHFFLASQTLGVQVKSVLTKAALNKMFKASAYAKHKYPNGKVTSFVTTDLSRIEFGLSFQPFLAGFPAIIAIVIVLLIVNVGAIALVGIGVFFGAIFLCFFAVKYVIQYRIQANILTDGRVTRMRELLNNMKMVKFYAWEDAYEKDIGSVRSQEVVKVRGMMYVRNLLIGLGASLPNFSSLATFLAMYKTNISGRTAANIFASLSLFQVLSIQMFFIPLAVTTGIDMFLGLGRLQELLDSPEEKPETRLLGEVSSNLPDDVALRMEHASFEWEDFQLSDALEEKGIVDVMSKEKSKDAAEKEKVSFSGFNDLNFEIREGEFVIITGPIGTGKTSLLSAMAGFMKKTAGNVDVNGDLLMCGYPWIQNATVRDNIIFGSPYTESKYKEVIRVCALQADLDILPSGDMTEIGERGITLSGGQKARINLARTVYKNKSLYLFDDVLSAVDSRVGKHIVDECLMGLLRDKTRVLATHQLSLIEKASRIIVLGSDGSFEIGELEELKKHNKTLNSLLQFMSQGSEEDDETDSLESKGNSYQKDTTELDDHELQKKEWEDLQRQLSKKSRDGEVNGNITEKEERAVNSIQFSVYKNYFFLGVGKIGFLLFPIFIVFVFGATFCNLFSSVWLSYWTENKFENRSPSFYMGLYSFFVFGGYFLLNGQFTLLCYLGLRASKNLNLRAVKRVLHSPMSFLDTTPIGRILNRFTKDTDSLDNELSESLRLLVTQVANIVGVCVLCIVYLPWFAIAIPFLAFMFLFIADHYQSTGREVKRLEAIQRSFVYNNFNEVLSGMDTIKSYRSQARFLAKTDFLINKMNEASYLLVALQRWVAIFLDLVAIAFALIITLLCVTRQFSISASSVGVLLTYVLQLPGLLNTVLRAFTQTENDMNSAERIIFYATELPTEADYKKPEVCPPDSWPSKGDIIFEDVNFAYRPGLPLVLREFNLHVKSQEKIGICGRTGAGKSTIMNAIYRINELAGGKILIDGLDISNLGLYDLRRNLSIIPQDPVLFKGTIRKNLDPFNQSSDDDLWEALVRGGAIPEGDLEKVKEQKPSENGSLSNMQKFHLDQEVEEEGFNFSLGERQILALTRALVRRTKILILDEATSSVDYETDGKIQARIAKSFNECTILCIAHRLKTILNYDRVLVLEDGEVAEFDTPISLFKQGGIFTEMCGRSGITSEDFEQKIV